MFRALVLFTVLLLAWLLWSGIYTPLLVGLGVLSSAAVVLLVRHLQFLDGESMPTELLKKIVFYWAWLFKEIIKSNIDVIRLVLNPKLPISPTLIKIPCAGMSDVMKVIYGNSISLTPGSVTVDIQEEQVTVHCLTKDGAEELYAGKLAARIRSLEER